MNKVVLGICGLVFSSASQADAIEKINGSMGIQYRFQDDSLTEVREVSYGASLRAPLGKWLGLAVSGSGSNINFELDADKNILFAANGSKKISSDTANLSTTLFLRKQELGSIGYKLSRSRKQELSLHDYNSHQTLFSSYYFDRVTVSLSRSVHERTNSRDSNRSSISGVWYLNNGMALSGSATGMDSKDVYSIGWRHQPTFAQEKAAYSIGYTTARNNQEVYSVGLSYFFGSNVNMKHRDRSY